MVRVIVTIRIGVRVRVKVGVRVQVWVRIRVRIRVGDRVRVRVRVRVGIRVRVRVRIRVGVRVRVRVRVRDTVRVRVRVRVRFWVLFLGQLEGLKRKWLHLFLHGILHLLWTRAVRLEYLQRLALLASILCRQESLPQYRIRVRATA